MNKNFTLRSFKMNRTLVTLLMVLVSMKAISQDVLLSEESFLYAPDTLHKLNGGSGFSGGWNVQNNNVAIPGYEVASSTPIVYPQIKKTGNHAIGGRDYLTAARGFNLTSTGPFVDYLKPTGIIGKDGTTMWLSFLLRKEKDNNEKVFFGLSTSDQPYSESNNIFMAGFWSSSSIREGVKYWTLKVDTNQYKVTNKPIVVGEAALFVAKIQFGTIDTITLFINPTELEIENGTLPSTFDARGFTGKDLGIRALALYLGQSPGNGAFDELRIGNSYKSVLPLADVTAPSMPTGLSVKEVGYTSAQLVWNKSIDNDKLWGYRILQGKAVVGTTSDTTITLTGLTSNTTTSYKVVAFDISNNVSDTTEAVEVTTLEDAEAPTTPTNLTALPKPTLVTLNWDASTDNFMVAGYKILNGKTVIDTVTGTTTTISGLASATEFQFGVIAMDAFNNESDTAKVTISTSPADIAAPSAPTGLEFTIKNDSIILKWRPSTDNDSVWAYIIYVNSVKVDTVLSKDTMAVAKILESGNYTVEVSAVDLSGNESTKASVDIVITSVKEASIENGISIYPNPTNGVVNIEVIANSFGNGRVSVVSPTGIEIMKVDLKKNMINKVDLSNSASGLYILKMEDGFNTYFRLIQKY